MKKIIWLLLFLPLAAFGQGVRYENHPSMKARADGALVAATATVAVCTQPANTGVTPCTPLATLYTDATLATPCTGTAKDGSQSGATNCSNTLVTDSKGNYHFYAKGGTYTIQVSGSGLVTSNETDVTIAGSLANGVGATSLGTIGRIFNGCYVDGVTYTTIGAAYADSTNCQNVIIPAKVGCYTETLSANLVFNRNNTAVIFEGCAIITQGAFQVIVSPGVKDFFLGSPFIPWGTDNAGGDLATTFTGYTGTAEAFKIGDSSADTIKIKIESIHIDLPLAGAGAIGFRMNRVIGYDMSKVSIFFGTGAGQIGILMDGNGNFTGLGTLYEMECQTGVGASNNVCIKENNFVTANKIIGGHCTLVNAGTSSCLDLAGPGGTANEANLFGFDCDNVANCITVESTNGGNLWGFARIDSTVGKIVTFGAGTVGNTIFANSNAAYTDTSGNNSVIYQPQWQVNSQLWQYKSSATTFSVQDVQAGGNNGGISVTHAGNTTIGSAGGGAGQNVIITNTGTMAPGTANLSDLGFSTLPWRKLIIGTAATNNFTFTPAATTAGVVVNIADPGKTPVGLPITIASGTSAMTTALIAAGACGTTVTTAATGTLTTDVINFAHNAAVTNANGGILTLNAWPTAGNVNFNYCNPTAAGVTPTAMTLNWAVVR